MEYRAQGEFRLGVAPADAGHDFGALFRGEDVHGGINAEKLKTEMLKLERMERLGKKMGCPAEPVSPGAGGGV